MCRMSSAASKHPVSRLEPGSGLQISFLALRYTPDSFLTPPFQSTSHTFRDAKNEI